MDAFDEFEQQLRDALSHLYDPTYQPPQLLCAILGCDPAAGWAPVQAVLSAALDELAPDPQAPPEARSRRVHDLLVYRYRQGLSQYQAAERLLITTRHLRREQQLAVGVLARHLWQRSRAEAIPAEPAEPADHYAPADVAGPDAGIAARRSQVTKELGALQKAAPGGVCDVCEAVDGVAALLRALAGARGVTLERAPVAPGLVAALHPSVLRQILVGAITEMIGLMTKGQVELGAERAGRCIRLTIAGRPASTVQLPVQHPWRELLAAQGGTLETQRDGDALTYTIEIPPADKTVVLVVDDNEDLVHFYERYVRGTRYQIVATAYGAQALEMVESASPGIIVLDVMLPDVDGWQLLVSLHEHPTARTIPVIVCSVVGEQELALALGASLHIAKPVHRQQFLAALDQVTVRAAAGPR